MSTAAKQTRTKRTITVDFRDEATYVQLLGDGKAFVGSQEQRPENVRLGNTEQPLAIYFIVKTAT